METFDSETVTDIPTLVVESIYDILTKALGVEVPYSSNGLEMAQVAVAKQKAAIRLALDLMIEHCFGTLGPGDFPSITTKKKP